MNLVNALAHVTTAINCGSGSDAIKIPAVIVNLIRDGIFVIQVIVPILLIIWGMLDFAKGIIGQDEDKIKAGQKKFIQRLIAAIIVFLIVSLTGFVIQLVGSLSGTDSKDGNNGTTAWDCANEIITGKKSS